MATCEEKKGITQNEKGKSGRQDQGISSFQYMNIVLKELFNVALQNEFILDKKNVETDAKNTEDTSRVNKPKVNELFVLKNDTSVNQRQV